MSRNPMLAKVHIARKELALDDDSYRAILKRITGQTSSAGLPDRQLDAVLTEFKRLGWTPKKGGADKHRPASAKAHVNKIFAVWADMCAKGIPTIANRAGGSAADQDDQRAKRAALVAFVQRMTKSERRPEGLADPEWLSVEEATKITEGLKAWRDRELKKRAGK